MNLKEHLEKFDEAFEDTIGDSPNPFSENLFASVEQLHRDIQSRDELIERKEQEVDELKSQIVIMERQQSTLEKDLNKSKWLENRVTLATKKVYDDKVKTIINENVDSKLIPVLTTAARRKQGNQQLNWDGWLKIPENGYLFQVNEDIAKKIFEDTNALIRMDEEQRAGDGAINYSLTFI